MPTFAELHPEIQLALPDGLDGTAILAFAEQNHLAIVWDRRDTEIFPDPDRRWSATLTHLYSHVLLDTTPYPTSFCGNGPTIAAAVADLARIISGRRLEVDSSNGVIYIEVPIL